MDNSLKLLEFFREYRKNANFNTELIVQYKNIIQSLIIVLNYNVLLKRKNYLLKELELSKIKTISSDFAAKTDLLKKLSEAAKENKKKLKYREEDFLFLKNQRDQIDNTIKNFNLKIQELNKKKKECFSQINRITREMSENSQKNKKNNLDLRLNNKNNLSKSEKIRSLQKQAKEFQYKINQIKSKLSESQLKFDEINPKYENLEKDYNSLLKIIKNDEIRLKQTKEELKGEFSNNMQDSIKEFDIKEFEFIKPQQEIEVEIESINSELKRISESNHLLDDKNTKSLIKIIDKLKEIDKTLKTNKDDILIPDKNDEINDSINNFRKIEILNRNLEDLLNKFLIEINLETRFRIIISKDYKDFSLNIEFIRSNKESLNFKELTTPEKIFFVIMFYISIQIHLNFNNIIFSNVFVPNIYNKRGSVFRTIQKMVPIFEKENKLKKFNLIFIISNLELKKPIKNVKIIKI